MYKKNHFIFRSAVLAVSWLVRI